jgi:cullin 3
MRLSGAKQVVGKAKAGALLNSISSSFGRQNLDTAAAMAMWNSLKSAIDKIFQHNSSILSFEELYGYGYKLCIHKQGDMLYNGVVETIRSHLEASVIAIAASPNETLLEVLKEAWDHYKLAINNVKDILMYMDRTYVKTYKKSPVYSVALTLFRHVVIYHENVRPRLKAILLESVRLERGGQLIDRDTIKCTTYMLVEIDSDGQQPSSYEGEFEHDFLQETVAHYKQESQEYIAQCTVPDYVKKAERRLQEEEDRATHYLAPSTREKLLQVLEQELVATHAQSLVSMENSGCARMFHDITNATHSYGQSSSGGVGTPGGSMGTTGAGEGPNFKGTDPENNLRRMYGLLSRVPVTLELLRAAMYTYLKEVGAKILEEANANQAARSPVRFVQQLLDLKGTFDHIVEYCFRADKVSAKKLRESFEFCVNQSRQCATFLSDHVNDLLKNALKESSEAEADSKLDKFVVMFRFLHDKDLFENSYKAALSKRLLSGKSISDDLERSMIGKMKAECGTTYVTSLEGMFTDMQLSKDVVDGFKQAEEAKKLPSSVKLEMNLLTAGFWPIPSTPPCRLPPVVTECVEVFNNYYLQKFERRKIVWITHAGSAELRATFPTSKKNLSVTTYQMAILMLFNDTDTLTLAQIQRTVGVTDEPDFKRHLLSLCTKKAQVLTKDSKGKGVQASDSFTFNKAFNSKSVHIRMPMVSLKEVTGEDSPRKDAMGRDALPPTVEKDRCVLIEACIVRIMKSRKTMAHHDLVAEVIRQLTGRFTPEPPFIKKRVETLLEREYLARDKDDARVYTYVA